ncbi:MAG: hypothetical protein OCD76_24915 [Reichenbachiella sp.]
MNNFNNLKNCFSDTDSIIHSSDAGDCHAILEERAENQKIILNFEDYDDWFIVKFEPRDSARGAEKKCRSIWSHFLTNKYGIQCRLDYVIFIHNNNNLNLYFVELKSGKIKANDIEKKSISTTCFVNFILELTEIHFKEVCIPFKTSYIMFADKVRKRTSGNHIDNRYGDFIFKSYPSSKNVTARYHFSKIY